MIPLFQCRANVVEQLEYGCAVLVFAIEDVGLIPPCHMYLDFGEIDQVYYFEQEDSLEGAEIEFYPTAELIWNSELINYS